MISLPLAASAAVCLMRVAKVDRIEPAMSCQAGVSGVVSVIGAGSNLRHARDQMSGAKELQNKEAIGSGPHQSPKASSTMIWPTPGALMTSSPKAVRVRLSSLALAVTSLVMCSRTAAPDELAPMRW